MKINESILQNLVKQTLQEEDTDELLLTQFGYNLVLKAKNKQLSKIVGRDNEIQKIIQVLCKRQKNNPILIGHSGVGKTAILEGLANWIVEGKVPEQIKNRQIYVLDYTLLISKSTYKGQFEGIVHKIINKLIQEGNYILFIDEIHVILSPQKIDNSLDLANILKPMLARGELPVIGATTILEYKKFVTADPAFQRRFTTVNINEMSVKDTLTLLNNIKEDIEKFYDVKINEDVLPLIVETTKLHLPYQYFPDKAIDMLDNICSSLSISLKNFKIYIMKQRQKLEQLDSELHDNPNNLELQNQVNIQHNILLETTQKCKKIEELTIQLVEQNSKLTELEDALLKADKNLDYNLAAELKHTEMPKVAINIENLQKQIKNLTPIQNIITQNIAKELLTEFLNVQTGNLNLTHHDLYERYKDVERKLSSNESIFYNELTDLLNSLLMEQIQRLNNPSVTYILVTSNDLFVGQRVISQVCKLFLDIEPIYINTNIQQFWMRFHSSSLTENGIIGYLSELAYDNEIEGKNETVFTVQIEDIAQFLKHQLIPSIDNIDDNRLNRTTIFLLTQQLDVEIESGIYKLGFRSVVKIPDQSLNLKLDILVNELTSYFQQFNCLCSNVIIFAKYVMTNYERFGNNIKELTNCAVNIINKSFITLLQKQYKEKELKIKFNPILKIFEIEKLIGK